MPDLSLIISRWWIAILSFTGVVTTVAFLILLLQPREYLSMVTALPASSYATDKARIFNNNIEQLYPSIGTADDLDRVVGTAQLDTLYLALVQEKGLVQHYKLNKANSYKATRILRANTRVEKSEYGELKIKVWDKDPAMAAALANGLFAKLQALHQALQSQGNALVLQRLQDSYTHLQRSYTGGADSGSLNGGNAEISAIKRRNMQEQLAQYEKLIAEYNLMLHTNPQALLVVESARPSVKADKPRVAQTLLFTAFASLLFGLLVAIALQSRK
jgi:uncharacterized protein involved in exopolysaccharide biosynthesis